MWIVAPCDLRMVATAEALGLDSEAGLDASDTRVLDLAWLDRWDVVVHIDYLPAGQEVELLRARHPSVKKDVLKRMVNSGNDLRQTPEQEQEPLTAVLTTRRLLAPAPGWSGTATCGEP